jgi:hypothetical protein
MLKTVQSRFGYWLNDRRNATVSARRLNPRQH